jgi:hypothetical protein
MKNTMYIQQNYKTSTLSRLKEYKEYSSDKKINACSIITSCLEQLKNTNQVQDELFNLIYSKRNNDREFLKKIAVGDAMEKVKAMSNEQVFELARLLGIK